MIAIFKKSGPMEMPKEGFYVKIRTYEDDGENFRTERFHCKSEDAAIELFNQLKNPEEFISSHHDDALGYIGMDDYGNWRGIDDTDIIKIEIINGIYYESSDVAIV